MTKTLLLFDVDNTLSISRGLITNDIHELLSKLSHNYDLATVSGSDLPKMLEQLDKSSMNFKWLFAENGLNTIFDHQINSPYHTANIINEIGKDYYQQLINDILYELSLIKLPIKRSNFIELRNGLINVSPIGRDCSQEERINFNNYDNLNNIRSKLCEKLRIKYSDKLVFSIGGQISIDIFPIGWDKRYCLQFIQNHYDNIHFFGDKIIEGGNDFEIGTDSRVIAHKVTCWNDTYNILSNEF